MLAESLIVGQVHMSPSIKQDQFKLDLDEEKINYLQQTCLHGFGQTKTDQASYFKC